MAGATEELLSCQLIEISRRDSPDCEIESFCSETSDEDSRQERHWVAVFLNKAGAGVSVEAFLEEGMVILSFSPATEEDIAEWKGTTQIKIPKCKFTKKEIHDTFLATEPMKVEGKVSRSCRKCIVAFLEKIGVTVPEDVRTGEARRQTESRPRTSAEENVPGTSSETQPVSSKEDTLTVIMEEYADKIRSLVEETFREKEAASRPRQSAKESVPGTSYETQPVSSEGRTPTVIMEDCFVKLRFFVEVALRTAEMESAAYDLMRTHLPSRDPTMLPPEHSEILQHTDDCIRELCQAVENLAVKYEAEPRLHTPTQGIVPQTPSTTEAVWFAQISLISRIWRRFYQLHALIEKVGWQLEARKRDTGGGMIYLLRWMTLSTTGIPLYRGTMSRTIMQEVENCLYVLKTAIQRVIAPWEATTKTELRQRGIEEVHSRTRL